MKQGLKVAVVGLALALGAGGAIAAPVSHMVRKDPWVQPIHKDSSAVPAKQFFEESQRDSE
jgi:hypothetical protein